MATPVVLRALRRICRWQSDGARSGRLEATLTWLREAHPDARAVRARARHPARAPCLPASASRPSRRPPPGAPGAGRRPAGDRPAVVRAYERARTARVSVAAARLLTGERVHVHFLDLRDSHGVMLDRRRPRRRHRRCPATTTRRSLPRSRGRGSTPWAPCSRSTRPASSCSAGRPKRSWAAALLMIHPDDHDRPSRTGARCSPPRRDAPVPGAPPTEGRLVRVDRRHEPQPARRPRAR